MDAFSNKNISNSLSYAQKKRYLELHTSAGPTCPHPYPHYRSSSFSSDSFRGTTPNKKIENSDENGSSFSRGEKDNLRRTQQRQCARSQGSSSGVSDSVLSVESLSGLTSMLSKVADGKITDKKVQNMREERLSKQREAEIRRREVAVLEKMLHDKEAEERQ
eukprot:gb/GECH01013207.1/.p1 GENE.gb/GECH01013207.1/~~gb/GECH01013207.1/.p1  ORF type:complete len:162 (+),score=14.99 gb/GECH01013207.1/:1-486(+)